jgi:hypothetical protein
MSDISYLNNGQWTLEKSNYGPKGSGQYNTADNAKRKMNNVGTERFGNQSVKSYTHRAFEHKVPKGAASPVKTFTPEEIEAYKQKQSVKLTKNGQWSLV